MNERIRELAREAGLPTYNPDGIPTKLEKFAELIIQECCDLIMKNQYSMVPGFMERLSAYSEVCMLKEHFGVEND
jgi:hypothetical protein